MSRNLVAGPYLYVNKHDTRMQRTICIFDNPWSLNIRTYFNGQQKNEDKQNMPDFETAIVRLKSSGVFYKAEGYTAKGIGNATAGSAPSPLQKK